MTYLFNQELWDSLKAVTAARKKLIYPEPCNEADEWEIRELKCQYEAYFWVPDERCPHCGK